MSQRDVELPVHYYSVFFERSQHILVVLDDDFVLDLCVPFIRPGFGVDPHGVAMLDHQPSIPRANAFLVK